MQLQKLGTERMQEIIEFDHLCFPNDFWKEEDWESLLRDERAIYYALLDDGRIVGDLFLYNWQGEPGLCQGHAHLGPPGLPQAGLG